MWLKSHVAGTANGNTFSAVERPGELGFEEKIAWVDAHISQLRRVGEAVLNREDPAKIAWALPKDPYQFIAACAELVQALDEGPGFKTRLPLTFDGTCSGLQHMCGMMRAEEGRFVNLTPNEEFDDFYRRVTFGVAQLLRPVMYDVEFNRLRRDETVCEKKRKCKECTGHCGLPLVALDHDIVSGEDRAWPEREIFSAHPFEWLMADQLDRSIGKPTGMTYFYGARAGGFTQKKDGRWVPYGMTKSIYDILKERLEKERKQLPPEDRIRHEPLDYDIADGDDIDGLAHLSSDALWEKCRDKPPAPYGARELATAAYNVIGKMVPRAKALRDCLAQLARLCSKNHEYLVWTTPLGLPIINWYHQGEIKRISLPLLGRRKQVKFATGYTDEIDEHKAADSATANFVHSVDAAHLQLVAIAAANEGIDLVTAHDCFGCIAPRARRLNEILRERYIHLHDEHNSLLDGLLSSVRKIIPPSVKMPPVPDIGDLNIEQVADSFHAWK